MKLTDKITTFEEALSVPEIAEHRYSRRDDEYWHAVVSLMRVRKYDGQSITTTRDTLPKHMWWWVREHCRKQVSSDAYGDVLKMVWQVPSLAQYAPRPSSEAGKIEFFPDNRAGEADRPVTTTLGRFLNKVSPLYSDEHIKFLDEMYRAEMSNEIELMEGAVNFRRAYLEGPSSCMSKYFHDPSSMPEGGARAHAEKFEGNHPVDAYDVPGVMIAVGRDPSGRINARCMVYVNPDKPDDKRMIRVYGDASLLRRLQRNGFVYGGLDGVRLRRIPLPEFDTANIPTAHAYCAPYLDGPAGLHASPEAGRNLIHVEGTDYLTVVKSTRAEPLRAHLALAIGAVSANYAVTTPEANGTIFLRSVTEAEVTITCPLTGRVANLVDEDVRVNTVYTPQGLVQALIEPSQMISVHVCVEGFTHSVYAPADTPVFKEGAGLYVDDAATRKFCGHAPLREGMYAEVADRWVRQSNLRHAGWVTAVDGFAYRRSDVIDIVGVNSEGLYDQWNDAATVYAPKDTFDPKEYVRLHSKTRGTPAYTTKNAKVYKTDTGRVVLPVYHDVVLCADGQWRFNRGLVNQTWMNCGVWLYMPRKQAWDGHLAEDHPTRARWVEGMALRAVDVHDLAPQASANFDEHGNEVAIPETRAENWPDVLWQTFRRHLSYFNVYRRSNGTLAWNSFGNKYDEAMGAEVGLRLIDEYLNQSEDLAFHANVVREIRSVWVQFRGAYESKYNEQYLATYGVYPPSMIRPQEELPVVSEPVAVEPEPVDLPAPALPRVVDLADVADAFAQADRLVA